MRPPKDLQDEWYKKLKESGFEDAENSGGHISQKAVLADLVHTIRRWNKGPDLSHNEAYGLAIHQYQDKVEYYRIAGHFLYDHCFDTENERLIWSHHAEGDTTPEILKKLKKHNISLQEIRQTIVNLRKIMLEYTNTDVLE
jgi:hypothetical protein